jgi:hypothetical protein
MKNYKVTYEVKDGLIRRKTYTFNNTIISNNPKEAFKEAKNFCKKSSRYLLYIIPIEKWSIKEIIEE